MQGDKNSKNSSPSNVGKLAIGAVSAVGNSLRSAANLLPITHAIGEANRFRHSNKSKGSLLLTWANFLFLNTPIWANDQGENLSIEEREKRLENKLIYFVPSAVSLPSKELFASAAKKSIQNSNDYKTKFLKELDDRTKQEIEAVFNNEGENDLKELFDVSRKGIEDKIASKEPQDSLDFRFSMAQLKELGHEYFKVKHEREKAKITEIFSAEGVRGLALKNPPEAELTPQQLGKLSDEQAERLKALETAQAEELKVYQNEMTTCIESTHKAQSQSIEKYNIISRLMANSRNREIIMQIVKANREAKINEGNAALEELDPDNLSGKDIADFDLDKLADAGIKTESGLEIKRIEQGVYEIKFPNHWLAPGYYFSANNNLETDLKEMFEIASLKYDGRVTFTLTGMSPDNAQKAARAAFNSWASLGKNPEDLVVKLPSRDKDGNMTVETKRYKDFFPDAPEGHAKAREDYNAHMAKHAPTDVGEIKKRIREIKAEQHVNDAGQNQEQVNQARAGGAGAN